MKIINKCDRAALVKDLNNFLKSSYARNHTVVVDNRLDQYGFNIPESKDLRHVSTDTCLEFLSSETDKHVSLTIGTSYFFPSIGDPEWEFYPHDEFPYPALKGVKGAHIVEIHCKANNPQDDSFEIDTYYRISLYEIDGVRKTIRRIARFENGIVIDENYLRPGEDLDDVLDFSNFNGPGEYRDALNAEGVGFGSTCCWGVSMAMDKYNLSFPDAMRKLYNNGTLIKVNEEKTFPNFVEYGSQVFFKGN